MRHCLLFSRPVRVMQHAVRHNFYYPSQTSVDKCFFRLTSGTIGFSPRLKNSGHVITFLRRCGLQNTNHVMAFWLWTACLIFPPFSKSRGRKDVKDVLYLLQRQLRKMHRMKKERFQLITYQETIDYQLECMLLPFQFRLYMLELRGRS